MAALKSRAADCVEIVDGEAPDSLQVDDRGQTKCRFLASCFGSKELWTLLISKPSSEGDPCLSRFYDKAIRVSGRKQVKPNL